MAGSTSTAIAVNALELAQAGIQYTHIWNGITKDAIKMTPAIQLGRQENFLAVRVQDWYQSHAIR